MAAQSGGSPFPDSAAVPLADGGADDRTEKICQTRGAAGIYRMISAFRTLVQNREILRILPCICRCTVFYGKNSSCHGFSAIYGRKTMFHFLKRVYQERMP